MLGLRKSLQHVRRKRKSSTTSSINSDNTEEVPSPSRAVVEAMRQNMEDSTSTLGKAEPEAAIAEVKHNGLQETTETHTHTSTNGHTTNGSTTITRTSSMSGFTRVHEVAQKVKTLLSRFDDYDEDFVSEMDLRSYLQYIADERLIHMPRRGSDWDRVLRTAQFFGLQIWSFGNRIDSFIAGADESVAAALASCHVLLEIGHEQAIALVPTFTALYELAMLLSTIGEIRDLEHMPTNIKEDAAHIFCDLVQLAGQVSTHYRQKIDQLVRDKSSGINFDAVFGADIDRIWARKNRLCDSVWAHTLRRKGYTTSFKYLREKLQPDFTPSIRNRLYDEVMDHLDRSEDTCHWIRDSLAQFLENEDHVLCVTGPPGCGKSVLAEWVQERLARPLDHKSYAVLTYDFHYDEPSEATSLACVKSILFQLLERSIGDIQLYEYLHKAFEAESKTLDAHKLEHALWEALRNGLRAAEHSDASYVLIIDGCDEMAGSAKSAIELHKTLRQYIAKLSHTHVITFSRRIEHLGDGCKHLDITGQKVHEDVKTHFRQTLAHSSHFSEVSVDIREQIVEDLALKSKGNFLWAFYVGRLLVREESQKSLLAAAQSMSSDVSEILGSVVSKLNLGHSVTAKHLLSFMLVAEQPLGVTEAAELLAVDIHKHTMSSAIKSLTHFVSEHCGDLILIRDGRLHFRTSLVRSHLEKLQGKALLSFKDAHVRMTLTLLLYARLKLDSEQEPLTDELDESSVDVTLNAHGLLGYVVRNWILHFRAAGYMHSSGKLELTEELRKVFPDTTLFPLLEWTCWRRGHADSDARSYHELALQIRKTCFGERHITIVQSYVIMGHVELRVSGSSTHGAEYFYQAIKLGKVVLSTMNSLVVSCTNLFLACTEEIVVTKRTTVITYREEIIRFMIEICKHKHGHHSDEVIYWYKKLAKLYIDIKEEEHATVVYRELYEIIVIRFGKKSGEAKEIGNYFGKLDIVFKGGKAEENIGELEDLIFETSEELEVTDQLCISMLLRLARSYVVCGKIFLAERLFISLWRRISIICRVNSNLEVHMVKIQIALAYVEFLRELKRTEEATNILICLWAEYEHYECEVEALIIRIREIGKVCRAFGLLSISVSILTKVWGWFKSKGKAEDEEAQRTTILITEVVEEVTETTITKKTTTTTTTEVTETVVKEIYEMHFTRCKKTKVDHAFFSACVALINLYIEQKNWEQVEYITKRTLEITWKAVLDVNVKVTLSSHMVRECIIVARRLAFSYHRRGMFELAEQIYLRIYHACLLSLDVQDESFWEVVTFVVGFYEEHHRHDKVLEIYIEVLEKFQKTLGHGHKFTIKVLYLLAAQYEILGRKEAYKYYLEIVTILNKGIKHCHHDAFKAALIMCRHYHSTKQWKELQLICTAMWVTIVHHREEITVTITKEIIAEIYEKYTYVLEIHAKVEFSVLYKLSIEYKEVITTVCGVTSAAFIRALIALAKMCEKREEHYHESVTIYEEVIKKITTARTTTTTTTEIEVHTVKKRLSKLYVTIITSGKKETAAKVSIDRAIEVCIEAYMQLKIELGCWHETTLEKLREVVILYQRVATQEAHVRIIQLLQTSVTEIITTLTVTMTLFTAATTLASIYVSAGLVKQGHELLHQLRHLIIFRGSMPSLDVTLKLDARVSKVVFVFLIAFEQGLHGKQRTQSYSEIMADIIFESLLYEEYSRVIEHEKRIEVVLECGAKLRCFWEEHKRTHLLTVLDQRLFQMFKTQYGTYFKGTSDDHVRLFYLALLVELGKDRSSTNADFAALACKAGNDRVRALLQAGDFTRALHLGRCVYLFATKQQLYHRRTCYHYGYKLAELLAGIDVPHPSEGKGQDELRKGLLETSREIMADVLAAFRAAKIDYVSLRFEDLAGLIRLLGTQGNYNELEALLLRLWKSREAMQKSGGWSPGMVLRIGKLLVHAQYAGGHVTAALDTAELLYYNLRRGRGRLDTDTLEVSKLLASLYTSSGRASQAMTVHEAILRDISFACRSDGSRESHHPHRTYLTAEARLHLELLKVSHHQMQGWTKPVREFHDMYERLKTGLKLDVPTFEKWAASADGKPALGGKYVAPQDWRIEEEKRAVMWKRTMSSSREKPAANPKGKFGMDIVRSASQWWKV